MSTFSPPLCLSVALLAATPFFAQSTPPAAPAPLDRLQHPSDLVTGEAGIAHVETRGRGTVPLVLIAGAPFGWQAWEGFLQRNEERYRMFAVTPAGYGGTPPPAMPTAERAEYTERAWTEAVMGDLVELIERDIVAAGLGPAVVVGHHLMGDYYAVRLAYEHPELVRAVLVAAGSASQGFGAGPGDLESRARFVREARAPFFRTVSQATWNANTFPASALSRDEARGRRLFEEEIGVPLSTQIRYYLEYLTDDLAEGIAFVQAPILVLNAPPAVDVDAMFARLAPAQREQLVKTYGSLDKAKAELNVTTSLWPTLATKAPPGLVRLASLPDSGIFVMDDQPAEFDRAVAEFVASVATKPAGEPR